MPRQPFYEASEAAYLFPAQLQAASARQWCAYELIRAYGIIIVEREFEHRVRVGSKFYQFDVLVSRRGVP
jgi:hypothetical protein